MNFLIAIVLGCCFILAGFVGATLNTYHAFPCIGNKNRVIDAVVLFGCGLALYVTMLVLR